MGARQYRWWHGVAFYAAVQAARLGLRAAAKAVARRRNLSTHDDRAFYRAERLPRIAPPAAAFPIAWTINSISAIAGGLHVLNLPADTEGRTAFLRTQAAAWALFTVFDPAYFGLRSPINAAAVTVLYTAATSASLAIALSRVHDSKAALSLAPTTVWLALATPLGLMQAAWNHDPFWSIGPCLEPRPQWLKKASA